MRARVLELKLHKTLIDVFAKQIPGINNIYCTSSRASLYRKQRHLTYFLSVVRFSSNVWVNAVLRCSCTTSRQFLSVET